MCHVETQLKSIHVILYEPSSTALTQLRQVEYIPYSVALSQMRIVIKDSKSKLCTQNIQCPIVDKYIPVSSSSGHFHVPKNHKTKIVININSLILYWWEGILSQRFC